MYTNSPSTSKVSKNIFLWGKISPTKNNILELAAALLAARHGVDKAQTQIYTLSAPKKRFIEIQESLKKKNCTAVALNFGVILAVLKTLLKVRLYQLKKLLINLVVVNLTPFLSLFALRVFLKDCNYVIHWGVIFMT